MLILHLSPGFRFLLLIFTSDTLRSYFFLLFAEVGRTRSMDAHKNSIRNAAIFFVRFIIYIPFLLRYSIFITFPFLHQNYYHHSCFYLLILLSIFQLFFIIIVLCYCSFCQYQYYFFYFVYFFVNLAQLQIYLNSIILFISIGYE